MPESSAVSPAELLPVLGIVARRLDGDVSLGAIASALGRSPFAVHRAFRRVTGETTKRYTSRLRLDRAAAELLVSTRSILDIALDSGFASHEVFTRAFLRRFGMSPRAYRARGLRGAGTRAAAARHAAIVRAAGPCLGLFHLSTSERTPAMSIEIARHALLPQPALIIRRRVQRSEIAGALGDSFAKVFAFTQQHGVALAGPPMARYVEMSLGSLTIEAGFAVAAAVPGGVTATGDAVEAIELPGGPAAVAIHKGAYDRLPETHAAIEAWVEKQQLASGGAPWESYITDPADHPDPADWRTEVVHPLAR